MKKETEKFERSRIKIQIQSVGGKVLESRDAVDAEKRDRESKRQRRPEILGTLGTERKEKG